MTLEMVLVLIVMTFIGFAVGRYGDKWGGHLNTPHHWIYGAILIVVGIFFMRYLLGIAALGFGIGHFISDFNDFMHMRLFGPDEPHEWKFWSVD